MQDFETSYPLQETTQVLENSPYFEVSLVNIST